MTTAVNHRLSAVDTPKVDSLGLAAQKSAGTAKADKGDATKLGDATRQFEAVLLRQMLSCLEKTTSMNGGKDASSGIYGSMLVDAVSNAIAQAGGLGLGAMLEKSLTPQLSPKGSNPVPPAGAETHHYSSSTGAGPLPGRIPGDQP